MDEGCTVEWSVSAPCLPFVTAVGLRGILRGFFRGPRLACLPTKMAADVVSPGASSSGHVTVVHFFSAAGLCKFLPFRPWGQITKMGKKEQSKRERKRKQMHRKKNKTTTKKNAAGCCGCAGCFPGFRWGFLLFFFVIRAHKYLVLFFIFCGGSTMLKKFLPRFLVVSLGMLWMLRMLPRIPVVFLFFSDESRTKTVEMSKNLVLIPGYHQRFIQGCCGCTGCFRGLSYEVPETWCDSCFAILKILFPRFPVTKRGMPLRMLWMQQILLRIPLMILRIIWCWIPPRFPLVLDDVEESFFKSPFRDAADAADASEILRDSRHPLPLMLIHFFRYELEIADFNDTRWRCSTTLTEHLKESKRCRWFIGILQNHCLFRGFSVSRSALVFLSATFCCCFLFCGRLRIIFRFFPTNTARIMATKKIE